MNFVRINGTAPIKTVPFLLLPLKIETVENFLKQELFLVFTQGKIIKEARKCGFEFKKIKKEPCLVNVQENTKKIFPLSVIASLFANLFVDESCILQTMEKFNQLKCENGERLDIFFNNLANFKS